MGIRLAATDVHVPFIHFIGRIERDAPLPVGSIGITNDPNELPAMIRDAVRRPG